MKKSIKQVKNHYFKIILNLKKGSNDCYPFLSFILITPKEEALIAGFPIVLNLN